MALSYEEQLAKNNEAMQDALTKNDQLHSGLIGEYKGVVDGQIGELDKFAEEQKKIQQEQTDFAISQIEQQKQQAQKDYTKEQSGAYSDWQKQSNQYGVSAEKMASAGLAQSGYSETSQVNMYVAYQNRVAAARTSFEQAKVAYDNAITEAKLANDVALAKIAADTFSQKAQLAMESVVYIGNLQMQRANAESAIRDTYYNREQDILGWQRQAKLDKEAAKDKIIEMVMNYGFTGFSAEELAEAGMTEADVQSLYAQRESLLRQSQSSGGGTGGNTSQGIYQIEDETPEEAESIEESTKKELTKAFPDGVIADLDLWDELINEYGEETVREWGYKPVGGLSAIHSMEKWNEQIRSAGTGVPAETSKYNYADDKVNAYFTQKDAVDALQKEYDNEVFRLNNMINSRNASSNPRAKVQSAYNYEINDSIIESQREYVNKLSRQLRTESNKLENMDKPIENYEYAAQEKVVDKALRAWEEAQDLIYQMKSRRMNSNVIAAQEEKAAKAKMTYDQEYEKLLRMDKYVMQEKTKGMSDYVGTFRTDRLK